MTPLQEYYGWLKRENSPLTNGVDANAFEQKWSSNIDGLYDEVARNHQGFSGSVNRDAFRGKLASSPTQQPPGPDAASTGALEEDVLPDNFDAADVSTWGTPTKMGGTMWTNPDGTTTTISNEEYKRRRQLSLGAPTPEEVSGDDPVAQAVAKKLKRKQDYEKNTPIKDRVQGMYNLAQDEEDFLRSNPDAVSAAMRKLEGGGPTYKQFSGDEDPLEFGKAEVNYDTRLESEFGGNYERGLYTLGMEALNKTRRQVDDNLYFIQESFDKHHGPGKFSETFEQHMSLIEAVSANPQDTHARARLSAFEQQNKQLLQMPSYQEAHKNIQILSRIGDKERQLRAATPNFQRYQANLDRLQKVKEDLNSMGWWERLTTSEAGILEDSGVTTGDQEEGDLTGNAVMATSGFNRWVVGRMTSVVGSLGSLISGTSVGQGMLEWSRSANEVFAPPSKYTRSGIETLVDIGNGRSVAVSKDTGEVQYVIKEDGNIDSTYSLTKSDIDKLTSINLDELGRSVNADAVAYQVGGVLGDLAVDALITRGAASGARFALTRAAGVTARRATTMGMHIGQFMAPALRVQEQSYLEALQAGASADEAFEDQLLKGAGYGLISYINPMESKLAAQSMRGLAPGTFGAHVRRYLSGDITRWDLLRNAGIKIGGSAVKEAFEETVEEQILENYVNLLQNRRRGGDRETGVDSFNLLEFGMKGDMADFYNTILVAGIVGAIGGAPHAARSKSALMHQALMQVLDNPGAVDSYFQGAAAVNVEGLAEKESHLRGIIAQVGALDLEDSAKASVAALLMDRNAYVDAQREASASGAEGLTAVYDREIADIDSKIERVLAGQDIDESPKGPRDRQSVKEALMGIPEYRRTIRASAKKKDPAGGPSTPPDDDVEVPADIEVADDAVVARELLTLLNHDTPLSDEQRTRQRQLYKELQLRGMSDPDLIAMSSDIQSVAGMQVRGKDGAMEAPDWGKARKGSTGGSDYVIVPHDSSGVVTDEPGALKTYPGGPGKNPVGIVAPAAHHRIVALHNKAVKGKAAAYELQELAELEKAEGVSGASLQKNFQAAAKAHAREGGFVALDFRKPVVEAFGKPARTARTAPTTAPTGAPAAPMADPNVVGAAAAKMAGVALTPEQQAAYDQDPVAVDAMTALQLPDTVSVEYGGRTIEARRAPDGSWSYTNAAGKEVKLPARAMPTVLAAALRAAAPAPTGKTATKPAAKTTPTKSARDTAVKKVEKAFDVEVEDNLDGSVVVNLIPRKGESARKRALRKLHAELQLRAAGVRISGDPLTPSTKAPAPASVSTSGTTSPLSRTKVPMKVLREQADKVVKALVNIAQVEVRIAATPADMAASLRAAGMREADVAEAVKSRGVLFPPAIKGRPYIMVINGSIASPHTIAHEGAHVAFLETFGDSAKHREAIGQLLDDVLRNGTPAERALASEIRRFTMAYQQGDMRGEEYFAELVGLLAASRQSITKPTSSKLAEALNKFFRKLIGWDIDLFPKEATVGDVIDFVNALASGLDRGDDVFSPAMRRLMNTTPGTVTTPSAPQKVNWRNDLQKVREKLKELPDVHAKLAWLVDNGYVDRFTQDGVSANYLKTVTGRVIVKVRIGDFVVPFYISTGKGGKADVATNKWYVFFGQGANGWFNKTSGTDMNQQYGSQLFTDIAGVLNDMGSGLDLFAYKQDAGGFMDIKWASAAEEQMKTVIDGIRPVQPVMGKDGNLRLDKAGIDQLLRNIEYVKNRAEAAVNKTRHQLAEEHSIRTEAQRNGTYMKAPNGAPSNLNEKQWIQVRTKAFKNWFGDWENDPANASKVVDENGEPLVVHHGSIARFDAFSRRMVGKGVVGANSSGGFYFASNKAAAEYFSDPTEVIKQFDTFVSEDNIVVYGDDISGYHVALSIPEDADDVDIDYVLVDVGPSFASRSDARKFSDELLVEYNAMGVGDTVYSDNNMYEVFLNLRNPAVVGNMNEFRGAEFALQGSDNDGITVRGVVDGSAFTDVYVAKYSEQIKSATDNVGTFDSQNPNIRLQLTSEETAIVDTAKAAGTYMKAPNGKPTKLNEKHWVQVRTKAFKNWFGDWEKDPTNASKVVDENGEPRPMYHGTPEGDFDEFRTGRTQLGAHVGTAMQSEVFANWEFGHQYQLFTNIRNPLRLLDIAEFDARDISDQLLGLGLINEVEAQKLTTMESEPEATKVAQAAIRKAGYDGVVYLNRREGTGTPSTTEVDEDLDYLTDAAFSMLYPEATDSYIVFDPGQLKSSIGNSGQFDGSNPDIRFQVPDLVLPIGISGSGKSPRMHMDVAYGADLIAAMGEYERDNTEFQNLPGGYRSMGLYEARNLLKKPSAKPKRVTYNNSAVLYDDWSDIINVDGVIFGLVRWEDPDAEGDAEDSYGYPKEFVWAWAPLTDPENVRETSTRDIDELVGILRDYVNTSLNVSPRMHLGSVDSQLAAHAQNGGSTFRINGENLAGSDMYAVSIFPERSAIIDGQITRADLVNFREKNFDIFQGNEDVLALGTWFNEGKTYIDISVAVPKESAVLLGIEYNQKAVMGLRDFDEINTFGDGEPMDVVKSEATRIDDVRKLTSFVRPVISPETSSNYANMTEDGEGNFVFYHNSHELREEIRPGAYGSNPRRITSSDEVAAMGRVGGMAMFYTSENEGEPGTGSFKHMIKVPIDRVYDLDNDELGLADLAYAVARRKYPKLGFDGNARGAFMTKLAEALGFDVTVIGWSGTTRAHSTKVLKPVDYERHEVYMRPDIKWKNFDVSYESNKRKGWVPVIPLTKKERLNKLYEKIDRQFTYDYSNPLNKLRQATYYSFDSPYMYFKSQEHITEAIVAHAAPEDVAEYFNILNASEDKRRSERVAPRQQIGVYHGTPYIFDRFSTAHIGEGEGSGVFGWGLYFTALEDVAKYYAHAVTDEVLGANEISEYVFGDDTEANRSRIVSATPKQRMDMVHQRFEQRLREAGNKPVSKKISPESAKLLREHFIQEEVNLRDKMLSKAQQDLMRTLYRVTLHAGKDPSEYSYVDWHGMVTDDQKAKVVSEIRKNPGRNWDLLAEGVQSLGEAHTGKDLYELLSGFFSPKMQAYIRENHKLPDGPYARYGDREASRLLLSAGIDGLTLVAGTIRGGVTLDNARGRNYVVFDEHEVTVESAIRYQVPDNRGEEVRKLFARPDMVTDQEVAEVLRYFDDWKAWYDGIFDFTEQMFGEYTADLLTFVGNSAVADGSEGTVRNGMRRLDMFYRTGDMDYGMQVANKGVYRYVMGLGEARPGIDKPHRFTDAMLGDSRAVAVDRHVWRIMHRSVGPVRTGKDSPQTPNDFAKAKRFVENLSDILGWQPREVQAALWAASIIASGGYPTSYEPYIQQFYEKGHKSGIGYAGKEGGKHVFRDTPVRELVQEWRRLGIRPIFGVRKGSAGKETYVIEPGGKHIQRMRDAHQNLVEATKDPRMQLGKGLDPVADFDKIKNQLNKNCK